MSASLERASSRARRSTPRCPWAREVFQRHLLSAATPLRRQSLAGVLYEDAPHGAGRKAEKMNPILPAGLLSTDEAKIDFVDQGRWLQSMVGALLLEIAPGDAAELAGEQGHQPVEGLALAFEGPFVQQICDVVVCRAFLHAGVAVREKEERSLPHAPAEHCESGLFHSVEGQWGARFFLGLFGSLWFTGLVGSLSVS